MIRYINTKQNGYVETIIQVNSSNFETINEFNSTLKTLLSYYWKIGFIAYISKRTTLNK